MGVAPKRAQQRRRGACPQMVSIGDDLADSGLLSRLPMETNMKPLRR